MRISWKPYKFSKLKFWLHTFSTLFEIRIDDRPPTIGPNKINRDPIKPIEPIKPIHDGTDPRGTTPKPILDKEINRWRLEEERYAPSRGAGKTKRGVEGHKRPRVEASGEAEDERGKTVSWTRTPLQRESWKQGGRGRH